MRKFAFLLPFAALTGPAFAQAAPIKYGAALAKRDPGEFQAALANRISGEGQKVTPDLATDPTLDDQLALWELLDRVGEGAITDIRSRPNGPAFLTWLGDHPRAIEDYLTSGQSEEYTKVGLEIWCDIWANDPASHDGLWLRVAIATSLVNAIPVLHYADDKPEDPMVRYLYFKSSYAKGALLPYFDKAPIWELRHVIGSWALESDMDWIHSTIDPKLTTQAKIGDACNMVPYRLKSLKGVSIFDGEPYYDNKPMSMPILVEYGGVCGAIAKFGAQTCQAYGVPAMPVTQPGHCAFIWKNTENTWVLGNDIFGWSQSGQHPGTRILWGDQPTYVWLLSEAFSDAATLKNSDRLLWLADVFKGSDAVRYQSGLEAANSTLPVNLPVAQRYLASVLYNGGAPDAVKAVQSISTPFENHPFALETLAEAACPKLLGDYVEDAGTRAFVDGALAEFAAGSEPLQHSSAAWARGKFLDFVLKKLTRTDKDFFTPLSTGKEVQPLYAALTPNQQTTYVRVLEASVKTALARKDLYAAPLDIYASLALKDESVRPRALAVLGQEATKAKSGHLADAHHDLCAKLVALSESAHDVESADHWRAELSASL